MTQGNIPPRERTLVELLEAARGLADIEAAIARLRTVAEMIEYDLNGFEAATVVDIAATLSSLRLLNEAAQATLQALTAANAQLQGFGRLVLRDLGAAGTVLLRAVPPPSEANN